MEGIKVSDITKTSVVQNTDLIYIVQYDDNGVPYSRAILKDKFVNALGIASNTQSSRVIAGGMRWVSGLTYESVNLIYEINGNQFIIPNGTTVTLDVAPSTATYKRIDLIYGDDSGSLGKSTGTADPNPVANTLNEYQLQLSLVLIDTDATEPTDVTKRAVYLEDDGEPDEFSVSENTSSVRIDTANTTTPITGTYSIKTLSALNEADEITCTHSTSTTNFQSLSFDVRVLENWGLCELHVRLYNGSTLQAGALLSKFINLSNTGIQRVDLFPSDFKKATSYTGEVDEIRFVARIQGTSALQFQLDNIYIYGDAGSTEVIKTHASDISLDTTNFDNNLDNTITDVQKLADAVDELIISTIPTTYADLAALVSAQGSQTTNYIYEVTDGSGFTGITSGILWVKYLGTTNGDESDYTWEPRSSCVSENVSPKYISTSSYGAVSDADISLGSTTFGTDNLTILQEILDEAQTQPLVIIWDGAYSVSGVLEIYSNTHIIGTEGSGVILRNASNSYVFKNANTARAADITSVPWDNISDQNIIIESLIINGNGYNTGTGGNTVFDVANSGSAVNGSAQTKRNQIIDFTGVINLTLKNIQLLGGRYWASHFSNVLNVNLENIYIDFGESSDRDGGNYDGLHFKGMTQNIRVKGLTLLNCKDDNVAFNAYSQLSIYEDDRGFIKDVTVQDVFMDSKTMGFGFYCETSPSFIDNVYVKNVTGQTESIICRITNGEDGVEDGLGDMGTLIFENINVVVNNGSTLQDFGGLFSIRGSVDRLIFRNVIRDDFNKASAYIRFSDNDAIVKQLIIDGVQQNSTGGTFVKPFLQISDGSVQQVSINNFQHYEETGVISSPVVLVDGGVLTSLVLNNIDTNYLSNIVSHTSGTLANILANNIHHKNYGSVGFSTSGTISRIDLSNYMGSANPLSGTFTTKRGASLDYLGEFTGQSLPSASSFTGSMVSISDEDNGYTRAFSDGTDWRRVYDYAIASYPVLNILLQDNFTGATLDTSKWDLTNPASANLTISQNNKLLFTRTTDVAVTGSTTENITSDNSYAKGGAVSVLINRDTGFERGVCSLRWIFNGTIDFIGIQGDNSVNGYCRLIVKQSNVIVYDFTTSISTNNRVKVTYDSSNNIKFWYWNGSSWTQMGSTQTYDVGASGTIMLSSSSDVNDDAGDVLSFDDLYVTDSDYTTETP